MKHGIISSSIRNNYEADFNSDDDDARNSSPGPGHYLTEQSSFKKFLRPTSLQLFGSAVGRFKNMTVDSGLGPGQYKPKEISSKYNSVLQVAGSASFKSPKREDAINLNSLNFEMPGPGDYTGE